MVRGEVKLPGAIATWLRQGYRCRKADLWRYQDVAVGNEELLVDVLQQHYGRDNVRGGVSVAVRRPPWNEDYCNIREAQHQWKCWQPFQ